MHVTFLEVSCEQCFIEHTERMQNLEDLKLHTDQDKTQLIYYWKESNFYSVQMAVALPMLVPDGPRE